jgi:hypothetical protein
MKHLGKGLVVIGIIALLPVTISAQNCESIEIEVTAEVSTDPGYEGLYKYTISGNWEVSGVDAVSYVMFSLGAECPCLCDSNISTVYFPNTAGTSTGEDHKGGPCEARYTGFIECSGLLETDDIVLKYEVLGASCDPMEIGTGTWIVYSSMSPQPWAEYPDAVYVKYGDNICTGTLTGELPDCYECIPVSVEEKNWGTLKSIYR